MDNLDKQFTFTLVVLAGLYLVGMGVIPALITGSWVWLGMTATVLAGAGVIFGIIGSIMFLAGKIFPDN